METKYIRAVVNNHKIHAQIVDGEVEGHDAWLVTLCGISIEELDKLIDWLVRIKECIKK